MSRLRSVYNYLRYVRIQSKYRSLDKEKWRIAERIALLVLGFEYAKKYNLIVPPGLRKLYQLYLARGVDAVLREVREKYLNRLLDYVFESILRIVYPRGLGFYFELIPKEWLRSGVP